MHLMMVYGQYLFHVMPLPSLSVGETVFGKIQMQVCRRIWISNTHLTLQCPTVNIADMQTQN
uniref:Uncharacterized protein n=1 Tax=Arundo donax TaxID=35708 RepID=A0A0A8ZG23_ARUDO